jgi:DNA repair photolyase
LKVFQDTSRSILSKNSSPDIAFTYSINPYRGCMHACAYCYARPTHQYLDFGAGTDFDRHILIKAEAPKLLREAFERRSWKGEVLVFSGNTDCYQPLEATYQLTRQCLEVCRDYRNPVSIITKSSLIERDIDVLTELARTSWLCVTISLPFADPKVSRALEPFAPSPKRRLKTMKRLVEAGIDVQINIAPIIPGLNDCDIPRLLSQAAEVGVRSAGHTLVRLPGPVRPIFEERLRKVLPLKADKIMHLLEQTRSGQQPSNFGERMVGRGQYWQTIERMWETTVNRLGLNSQLVNVPDLSTTTTFRRPGGAEQLKLF